MTNIQIKLGHAGNIIPLRDTVCDLWLLFLSNEDALIAKYFIFTYGKTTYINKKLTELQYAYICVRDAAAGTKLWERVESLECNP